MDKKNNEIIYSPTDLVNFIESPYSSWLDHYCIDNPDYKKNKFSSKLRDELFNLGNMLEANYYRKLENYHFKKVPTGEKSITHTRLALNTGYKFIAQAHLKKGNFEGFADLLVREKGKSKLGNYCYTVKDIKRASVPKAKFIIQICCYLEMLEDLQGFIPKEAGIILGHNNEELFNVQDFYDYYLNIKKLFLEFHENFDPKIKPTPSLQESLGDWEKEASIYLEKIDSLLLLPSIDTEDIKKLEEKGLNTRKSLLDFEGELDELSSDTLDVYQTESSVQLLNKEYKLFKHNKKEPKGLLNLPRITEDDLFINIKVSDSYHKEDLFYSFSTYTKKDGLDITFCMKKDYERGYIYKFLKKIKEHSKSGKIYFYGSSVLDNLQKAASSQGIFLESLEKIIFNKKLIDLQLITKQSIAIPFYNYRLDNLLKVIDKDSEFEDNFGLIFNFYYHANKDEKEDLKTKLDIQEDTYFKNLIQIAEWLTDIQCKNDLEFIPHELRYTVENEEESEIEEESESFEYNFNLEKYSNADSKDKIGILLKQLINFYKNEKRPKELETIDLLNQTEAKLEKSTRAISFLRYKETRDLEKPYIREYSYYKNQEYKISDGDKVMIYQNPKVIATVKHIDKKESIIVLQFTKKQLSLIDKYNKLTIIEHGMIPSRSLERAVLSTAFSFDIDKDYLGLNKSLYDFLYKNYPDIANVRKGDNIYSLDEDLIEASVRAVKAMNNTCLIFQGPPGAGKTFTTRKIVYDLILEGKKVAISSNSHKAINNVINELSKDNPAINVVKMGGKKDGLYEGIKHSTSLKNLDDDYNIFGGTAFSLCNPDLKQKFDYLFIDEAGQVSIPNLIAMSQCAKNIVLIGDQMQLEQPLQAIHPGDSGKSCLEYYLGDKKTIPQSLGFFLPVTRRMNSELTKVISDNFYEGKLTSFKGSDDRRIILDSKKHDLITKEKGFVYIPVKHKYNKQYSSEEIDVIEKLKKELIGSDLIIDGVKRKISNSDIIYVSPYNMQVKKIKERLGEDSNAGSVDLFQGQEAPIVIISLASSESSSRGLEFLLSDNRLNVAISRGQAMAILIGNRDILRSSVSSIEELRLLNLFSNLVK
jgi:uncharacterized protein